VELCNSNLEFTKESKVWSYNFEETKEKTKNKNFGKHYSPSTEFKVGNIFTNAGQHTLEAKVK
jgi:hypothetical protein